MYTPAIYFTKISILLFYRRIFSPSHKNNPFDILLRLFILILTLFYTALIFLKIFECQPRARIWDPSHNSSGRCLNIPALLNASGFFNTITDVLILLIPMRGVWGLQITRSRKVGIVLVFAIGFTYVHSPCPLASTPLPLPSLTLLLHSLPCFI